MRLYRTIFLTSIDFSSKKSRDICEMHLRLGKRRSNEIRYGLYLQLDIMTTISLHWIICGSAYLYNSATQRKKK